MRLGRRPHPSRRLLRKLLRMGDKAVSSMRGISAHEILLTLAAPDPGSSSEQLQEGREYFRHSHGPAEEKPDRLSKRIFAADMSCIHYPQNGSPPQFHRLTGIWKSV